MEFLQKKLSVDKEPVERLFNFRPLLFSAFFLCLGILFSYLRECKEGSPLLAALPFGVLLVAFLLKKDKKKALAAVLALAFAFSIGAISFSLNLSSYRRIEVVDGYYTVEGRVTEKALGGERCKVRLDEVTLDGEGVNGGLTLSLPASVANSLQLSDRVQFFSRVQVDVGAFDSYGFRGVAIAENIRFKVGEVSEFRVTGHQKDWLLTVRQKIGDTVRKGMDEIPAAVTLAILLGDTSAMDEDLLENVRKGGIAHIFAVSGLHIGTLFAVLTALMGKTKLYRFSKFFRWLIVLTVLLFYGGVCGYSASVVRSIVTCLALYFYRLAGGKSDTLETISFAAVCVLLFQPTQLFAVGFQLSFAACYGIAFLARPFADVAHAILERTEQFILRKVLKIPPTPPVDMFVSDTPPPSMYTLCKRKAVGFLSVSVAAQAFTFPILLLSFGYVSNAGLLLNCLFVPLLGVAFCPLLFFCVTASILAALEKVVLFLPNTVLSALMLVFQTLDFSKAVTEGLALSVGTVGVYYLWLLCFSDKWNITSRQKRFLIVLCGVAFAISLAVSNV